MADAGKYAFMVGLAVAVLTIFVEVPYGAVILAVLGLAVGFLNVSGAETQGFLLAAIGLMMSATAIAVLPMLGDYVTAAAQNFVALVSPAVLVVSVKSLLGSAKD